MEYYNWREDYECLREVPRQGWCGLHEFAFTTGIVTRLDDGGYYGRYCYAEYADAYKALREWDGTGDPPGPWIKYKGYDGERLGPGATT